MAVALAALTAVATLAVAGVNSASASTLNGIATTALPSNDTYLASGGSNTLFTVALPPSAACTGDTAHDGYHVWSYLVKQSESIAATTFSAATGPSQGFGLYESDLNYYGPINTAQNTGEIIQIPNDFSWGAGVAGGSFTAADLLYTGGTSGIWEAGIACANSAGTLTDNWNTEVTFTSSLSDPNLFTWSAVPGPSGSTFAAITSADATTFTEGTAGSFTPTATGNPSPTITETGPLPTGVTFTGGALTGTPTESGNFPITFKATNGIGDPAVQSFTLTVASSGVAPTITSADATSFTEGTLSTFTPTATGSPAPTITETGPLPTGVTFTGGSLTGTATESGTFPITFKANNGIGNPASQAFTLTVGGPPSFTSANNASFTEGSPSTFTPVATGSPTPTVIEAGPLPTGVSFTAGSLTGTPTVTGTFPITFTASNGILPNATQNFTLTVGIPPVITSAAATTFSEGSPGTFTPIATGTPAPTFGETGALPTGVTFTGGSLTGTPTVTGSFPITLTASNGILP
ncbi:MAG TPA: putative Ig domain-containing protein, partial [Acidimicrobiales bacterium]|nr:putative Ig domain-containing protein [Acidimicrobiales bacterium]